MDRYGKTTIIITEEDFKKDFWGLGFLLKSFFFNKNSGELKLSFPDNIDEILLNLIKSQNKYNEIHNHAIYYANMFTMDDGHICKNPIIKLKKKKIKPAFSIVTSKCGNINMNLAFTDPDAVKLFNDLDTIYVDSIEYTFVVEVILGEDKFNKLYSVLVYDIVDSIYNKINSCECFDEALPHYDGYTPYRNLGEIYDGYDMEMITKIYLTDKNPNYIVVKNGLRCYRVWMNENDITMIQEIGGSDVIEYDKDVFKDKFFTKDEFFEKYPNLKNDWENVI